MLRQPGSVAVVSPHRAQCAALRVALLPVAPRPPPTAPAARAGLYCAIDTVEKLQGREAPVVILSATASRPAQLAVAPEFYASLERANVAVSRARERLVVVVSEAMLGFAPPEVGSYRGLEPWKALRASCAAAVGNGVLAGARVRVYAE